MKQDNPNARSEAPRRAGKTRGPSLGLGRKLKSLSAKLLLITAAFVMLAQVLIFVPAVANFRREWLVQRVIAAKIASLAVEASAGAELPDRLRQDLLMSAGVHAVSLKRPKLRLLVLGMPENEVVSDFYDIRDPGAWTLVRDGLAAFVAPPGRLVRIVGAPDMMPNDQIDIVIDETPLHSALWSYAGHVFWVSLAISASTAVLVYLCLNALLVGPMMRLTRSIVEYRDDPEDPSRIIRPSNRSDEIGVAEKELASLQTQLTAFLRERSRLASIGLAVSKINHDLRNMLSSAQLVSDRLATVPDPTVQHFVPRLIRALDRAIGLCFDILKFGGTEQITPQKTALPLLPVVRDVFESLGADSQDGIAFTADIAPDLEIWADRDHAYRVLNNLIRNAFEALKSLDGQQKAGWIRVEARSDAGAVHIRVADNGPGLPLHMRNNVFKPFTSSRRNGTGLGLVIAADLIRAHGGDIWLEEQSDGAAFVIKLPVNQGQAANAGELAT